MLTALGFLYFAESKVEIAVLEVGMGGRLDATNVVDPLLSIVTDISLDHMEWLGPTIAAIAREKAGILRRGGTMITLPQHPEANQVLGEVATELDVRGVSAAPTCRRPKPRGPYTVEALGATVKVDSPLAGRAPAEECGAGDCRGGGAGRAAWICNVSLRPSRWGFAARAGRDAWSGSRAGVEWVLDVAHNPAGAWALRAGLRSILEARDPRILVFSCLRDKPWRRWRRFCFRCSSA
jgi:dihydrofolate synthase / folylpolyglutamate synthase